MTCYLLAIQVLTPTHIPRHNIRHEFHADSYVSRQTNDFNVVRPYQVKLNDTDRISPTEHIRRPSAIYS